MILVFAESAFLLDGLRIVLRGHRSACRYDNRFYVIGFGAAEFVTVGDNDSIAGDAVI